MMRFPRFKSLISLVVLLLGCSPARPNANSNVNSTPMMSAPDAGNMAMNPPDAGVDTDGDGLDDSKEAELGTDPTLVDTDGDGYTDFQEVHAGTDPKDSSAVIYKGGWPYNPNKDEFAAGSWETPAGLQVKLPRYKAIDQYGDEVDLYDLIGHGKPIVFDVGTWFCEPCKDLASYLSVGDCTENISCTTNEDCLGDLLCDSGKCQASTCVSERSWWNEDYEPIYDMVKEDKVFWITVLFSKGSPVEHQEVELWHNTWPNSKILVLADTDLKLQEYMNVNAMPRIDVLDENLVFETFNLSGPGNGLRYLITNY